MTGRNLNDLDNDLVDRILEGRTVSREVRLLVFIHQRLVNVYGENPLFDYMHGLRDIITKLDAEDYVRNIP
jgi:hypothetical protein